MSNKHGLNLFTIGLLFFVGLAPLRIWAKASSAAALDNETHSPLRTRVQPKIDGLLDDEAWQSSPIEKKFISLSPLYGEVLPYQTRVWLAYDSENLYFAFQCLDPEPQKIKTSITKRDNMYNDDWIGVSLDTHGNKQTAYGLYVNPSGIQGDLLNSAVKGMDISPDFVWESAARMTDSGYQVEICLPLRSITFASGKEVRMGIVFLRQISRSSLIGSWPQSKPGQKIFVTQAAVTYKELKNPLRLELLPSITYGSNRERRDRREWEDRETFTGFGIGLKYGITSSITADITINPDFSQVESDAFQVEVNRRYPLFYSEKRPFFMEGVDVFGFFTIPSGYLPTAVHTRQIADPSWGAKLTGTVGRTNFGVLAAGDKWPGQVLEPEDSPNSGKSTFFGIARGKYSLGKDNYMGFLYSGREFAGEYNRVLGADIGYRWKKHYNVNASFLYSTSGSNSNNNQYLNSSSINFMYTYKTKPLEIQTAFEHIGKDFSMDTAYLRRTGINEGWGWMAYNFHPNPEKLPWLKQISPNIFFQYLHDLETGMDDSFLDLGLNFSFTKQAYAAIDYIEIKESWEGRTFELEKLALYGEIQLTRWLNIGVWLNHGDKIYYADPAFQGKGNEIDLILTLQPNKNFNQYFSFYHSDLTRSKEKIYDVNIYYSRTTYQFNKYFFLRAVVQYNSYQKRMLTDFLASFTLIPGTVLHAGYGGLYENKKWQDGNWLYGQGDLLQFKRSFFLKASYLWRF